MATHAATGKAPYEKKAAADKARHTKEMASYTPPAGAAKAAAAGKAKRFGNCSGVRVSPPRSEKDPNAPKRPLSAYFIFSNESREEVKKANPGSTVGDVCCSLCCVARPRRGRSPS